MRNVPVFKPLLESDEKAAAVESLDLGWLGMGSYVADFEKRLSEVLELDGRYLACLNTGHSALHLALVVAGVGPGDEVISPSFNCVSDFQAILSVGATPVLCDCEDDTLGIDVTKAEALVTERTKAVIAMDYGCAVCDHTAVQAFAARHGLRVVHDAAHSMGGRWQGKMVGSFSDMTMLSFDPVKTITALDAGALIVSSEDELRQIHELRILGMGQPPAVMYQNKRAWTYHVERLGFRYHLLNLHAAIGLRQLDKLDRIAMSRLDVCAYYHERFQGIRGLRLPPIDFKAAVPFIYYLRVLDGERDTFRAFLSERGVDTGIHWQPGHSFALFANCQRGDLSVTERIAEEIVTIPLHSSMDEADRVQVADAVVAYFREGRARRAA